MNQHASRPSLPRGAICRFDPSMNSASPRLGNACGLRSAIRAGRSMKLWLLSQER
jgi:hypothetical protein